jgi:hypothetical protein
MAWKEIAEKVASDEGNGVVSRAKLFALHFSVLCQVAYDPETPAAVVTALKIHPDASVRAATRQRDAVLANDLMNPYQVEP